MNFNELKQLSAEYGFELVSVFANNYVLILALMFALICYVM